jgi:hypothetical protein
MKELEKKIENIATHFAIHEINLEEDPLFVAQEAFIKGVYSDVAKELHGSKKTWTNEEVEHLLINLKLFLWEREDFRNSTIKEWFTPQKKK